MRTSKKMILVSLIAASTFGVTACGGSSGNEGAVTPPIVVLDPLVEPDKTDQLILKYKVDGFNGDAITTTEAVRLSKIAGVNLTSIRSMSDGVQVLKLDAKVTVQAALEIATKLAFDPLIQYVEPDQIMISHQAVASPPNDPMYINQWNYSGVALAPGGANIVGAWGVTTGLAPTVVAVIDTGMLQHTDLVGRYLPGYDFITGTLNGDGSGRDADPTDPGDSHYQTVNGSPVFVSSSWHGTRVAGIIGATANNAVGIAGINWNAKILPIRAIGKQAGLMSDIIDAMKWASGLTVAGVPANSNPAKVINMSLGSLGFACSSSMQTAINAVLAKGVTIVVSAGNDYYDVAYSSPANCNGVISVGSVTKFGNHANYSNSGVGLSLSAPGGYVNDPGILSAVDGGTTTALNDNTYQYAIGTSFAAPQVAGVASLMYSMVPTINSAVVKPLIVNSARAFPAGSTCLTFPALVGKCGSGILDGGAAMAAFKNSNAFCAAQVPSTC
jgi:Subtilase family